MQTKKNYFTAKRIALVALLTAFVIATSFIPPLPLAVGRIYWCDGMIFLAAYLVDPISSLIIGGMGTFIYDLIVGSAYMAPFSLVIHGLQALLTSLLLHYVLGKVLPKKAESVSALLSSLAGAVVMIGLYFLYRTFIAEWMGDAKYGVTYAISKLPANLVQEAVGIAVALVIAYVMQIKKLLIKQKLLLPVGKSE